MKEWYFINVTNVVTDHLKSQILNFDKHMQERVHKYAEKSMMENNYSVKNAITKVLQNNHWNFTYRPSMMELDMHVVNVTNVVIEHLKSKTLKNTCRNIYMKMGKINWNIIALHVITKLQERCHLSSTNRSNMNGSDIHVVKCDHQVTSKQILKLHMATKHDVEQFRCEKCDYQSASKHSLKLHTQSKHDGIR